MLRKLIKVKSPNVQHSENEIISEYSYDRNNIFLENNDEVTIIPQKTTYQFMTKKKVPKLGVMIVGIGGNNGTTLVAGCLANREGLSWRTKKGIVKAKYIGSYTQAATIHLGDGVYAAVKDLLPMVNPNDIVFTGWDINNTNLAEAMERAQVLEPDLQRQVYPIMVKMKPLPAIFDLSFIASNQNERANNILDGTIKEKVEAVRNHIKAFKEDNNLDKVIILWSGNTEQYSTYTEGIHDTADNILRAIDQASPKLSPSTLYAVAGILEGCDYINGSPQNTLMPGVIELAEQNGVYVSGDDLKTGQTRLKSVLVDFLVSIGIKPRSIVSYNHLGNNDGKNLSEPLQFRSKEISKSSVIDDVLQSNEILYDESTHIDHAVIIKYIPHVGDDKRAIDEYVSEIFLGGESIIEVYNMCQDSLLAVPVMLDLVILDELYSRITWKTKEMSAFERFHPVNSSLSLFLKAPLVPENTPVVNVLYRQRLCIENLIRVCIGLAPENFMLLDNKCHAFTYHHESSAA
jgi:myo-inositol-1-phosphate synthase